MSQPINADTTAAEAQLARLRSELDRLKQQQVEDPETAQHLSHEETER